MRKNTFNRGRGKLPEIGDGEIQGFGKEHYDDLLQEAEQYRLERRLLAKQQPARQTAKSPIAHLLVWAGILKAS